ncbi:polysaccharide pyruvyl transferase family protein [Vibrio navarrensis]|uniref:Polysaccharide pyruvyl transferase family protein n=1 Tax=Vibrio navarrensis TaxID=29495 RepID=A0AAI9CX38_9VIBR|nr:polysaccharide pyruvyl transferase family protein [Vibrio navarrensis]ELN6933902.1 polysaccharide pyruvyl transferase family protein [Vibrio navarrensis]
MRILIINESLGHNLGDHAIQLGLSNFIREKFEYDVVQLGFPSRNGVRNNQLVFKRKLFFTNALHPLRLFLFSICRIPLLIKAISKSDKVVIGGGSLLINNKLTFPISLAIITLICRIQKKEFIFLGISSRRENSKFANFLLRNTIKYSSEIYCRDIKSISVLDECYNVSSSWIPDLALNIERKTGLALTGNSIAINIMGRQAHGFFSSSANLDKYRRWLEHLIQDSLSLGYKVNLFTTGESSDNLLMVSIVNFFGNEKVTGNSFDSLDKLIKFVDKFDIVVGTRLHSAIIPLARGSKVACFNWDSKVSGFFKTIGNENSLLNDTDTSIEKLIGRSRSLDDSVRIELNDVLGRIFLND